MIDVLVTKVYTFDMQITMCFMYFKQIHANYLLIKDNNETALHFIMVTIKVKE